VKLPLRIVTAMLRGMAQPEDYDVISITDIKDFIDLDKETVYAVHQAQGLPADEAITLAHQLLATETGLIVLHHMFRDQIADAEANRQASRATEMRQAYAYFARKYPMPHVL
jgi:hypothetical protein